MTSVLGYPAHASSSFASLLILGGLFGMMGSKFCILGTRPDQMNMMMVVLVRFLMMMMMVDGGGGGEVYDDGGGDENDGEETHLKHLVWCR